MSVRQQPALIVESPHAPFVLGSCDIPSPARGEVLVKIMSAALNPASWIQRELNILIDEYPVILGSDIAGVIEELGEGVEGFSKGDKVFGGLTVGGFQQYTTIHSALLIRMPENASFDEVATFPVAFTTACVGLFGPAPIGLSLNPTFSWDKPQQGQSALIIGASSSVGQFAIQLLRFVGFMRIVAYASAAHFDYLTQLGATHCIDRTAVPLETLAAHPALTPAVPVVFDVFGSFNSSFDCAADGGSVVTARPMGTWDADRLAQNKTVALVRAGGLGSTEHTTFGRLIIKNLPEMLAKGVISANRIEVLPNGLTEIPEGLERIKNGAVSGVKLVAHPQDSTL
ncbi:GroES-like protein [Mycena galericulata]|nr:GroES-like protein [Mycena galericulata]